MPYPDVKKTLPTISAFGHSIQEGLVLIVFSK
jgi:hypothetical protein